MIANGQYFGGGAGVVERVVRAVEADAVAGAEIDERMGALAGGVEAPRHPQSAEPVAEGGTGRIVERALACGAHQELAVELRIVGGEDRPVHPLAELVEQGPVAAQRLGQLSAAGDGIQLQRPGEPSQSDPQNKRNRKGTP